jgi:pentatricopeptide repeat protein
MPELATYNRVINACQHGGNGQSTVDLMTELTAAGLTSNDITYKCVINSLHAANEHDKAEHLYLEMLQRGLIQFHWSVRNSGMLDFHDFNEGMAAAALRIVLRDIVAQKATAYTGASSGESYVHPIANDFYIITGHALKKQ